MQKFSLFSLAPLGKCQATTFHHAMASLELFYVHPLSSTHSLLRPEILIMS
jgi:hypothetical protein